MEKMRPAVDIAREHMACAKALRARFWPAILPRQRKRIGVFPYPLKNPFLPLLYSNMRAEVVALPSLRRGIRLANLGHVDALHIQFEDQFWRRARFEPKRTEGEASAEFIEMLDDYISSGGHLAWTLHDAESHYEDFHSKSIREIRSFLANSAHVVHTFSSAGAQYATNVMKITPERIVVIPHPSYIGAYGDAPVSEPPPDRRRFLSFGTIRPFKGIEQFLDALGHAKIDATFDKLVVAGEYLKGRSPDLEAHIPNNRTVDLRYGIVKDEDVSSIFADTDFAVLNYQRVLTSGFAALAMTMGKPIVGVDRGGLKEAVPPENHALLYDPSIPDGLATVIERACAMSPTEHLALQLACREFANQYHPFTQSRLLEQAFEDHGVL
ncbi:glycosyltransferase family 4 protein [Aliiruegeria lutimaris]|uniref:Glycosyl transferases group 1 n=1 Tax=Aliiruegeria lutimaris TaxID=571298 RepID=A0A1G9DS89_9RHOB|nr:glycosyltransferase family 4 protein [Aliiruegeria lutimaris]SDK66771.1 Glycosyl transferases group 1 [Aliiruegeria lutimaris]